MKGIWLAAVLAICASAQTVTIAESAIKDTTGHPATGKITISPEPPFTASDGTVVAQSAVVYVVGGKFSVALEPNLGGNPAGSYSAQWQLTNTPPMRQTWVVTPSSSTLTVTQVLVHSPVTPTWIVHAWQLDATGLAVGMYCFSVNATPPNTFSLCSGGSGGGNTGGLMTWNGIGMSWNGGSLTWN